jgi:hypothetical protein
LKISQQNQMIFQVAALEATLSSIAKVTNIMSTILARYFDLTTLNEKPVIQAEKPTPKPSSSPQEIAAKWIGEFDHAIQTKNASAVANSFQEDGIKPYKEISNDRMVERRFVVVVGLSHVSVRHRHSRHDSTTKQ